ncbi:MAG TPA: RHS repeat-associated core domain-containing protein [Gemmatimonadaceae bacterium]|nr:RHS repeat-associated core domain-containing protein [Gemmatimonadaceae bacterium]
MNHPAVAQQLCDSCSAPAIIITPPLIVVDTALTITETISACDWSFQNSSSSGYDTVTFNGTVVSHTPFTSYVSSGCSGGIPYGYQNNPSGVPFTLVAGSNVLRVAACGNDLPTKCSIITDTIVHPPIGVTPKNTPVSVSPNVTGATQVFYVHNYMTGTMTDTLTVTCTGSGISSCHARTTVAVTAGTPDTVVVTYNSSTPTTTGTIQLKAKSGNYVDSGSVNVTVSYATVLTLSTAFNNQDDQDMSRCAANCFAVVEALSTVPYVSRDTPRNVTLVYHGDRVAVRPFLYADVALDTSLYTLTSIEFSASYQVNGNWLNLTFLNGRQSLYYVPASWTDNVKGVLRMTGQVDMSAVANTAWAAAPLKISVTATFSDGHQETHVDSSLTLSVVSERKSPIAYGWSIAGLPHIYGRSDNTASEVVIREGDGSTTMYIDNNNCVPNCIWMPTGPGVFSRIDCQCGGDSLVFVRSWPDSTREYFYGSGVKSGNIAIRIDRFNDTTVFGYDSQGRLTSISDPYRTAPAGGHAVITLNYNSTYGLKSIVEPGPTGAPSGGRTTTITIGADSTLQAWADPDSVPTSFTYDTKKRLSTMTDRGRHVTTFSYDTLTWKLLAITAPSVQIDTGANRDTVSLPLVTRFQPWQWEGDRSDSGTITNPIYPLGTTAVYGGVFTATHDTTINSWTYIAPDRWGQPTKYLDPNALVTTYGRDANGFDTLTTYPTGMTDHYAYSGPFLMSSQPAGQSNPIDFAYGTFGIPTTISGTGIPTVYEYFTVAGRGRIDSTRVGTNNPVTAYTYDNLYRNTKVVDPLGHTTVVGYAVASGNLDSVQAMPSQRFKKTVFDGFGRDSIDIVSGFHLLQTDTTYYDKLNRVVGVKDGVHSGTMSYHYDSLYLRSVTDLKGQTYQTTYNAVGWPVTQTDPANRTTVTTYNRQGLPATVTNRRSQLTQYYYDNVGRPLAVHRPSNRTGEADIADSIKYSSLGDMITNYNAVTKNVTYISDANGWVDSTITTFVPHSMWWKRYYHHNALGQVDSIASTTNGTAPLHTRHFYWDAQSALLDSLSVTGGTASATHLGYSPEFIHDTTNYPAITRIDSVDDIHGLLSSSYSSQASATFNRNYAYDSAGRIAEVDFPDSTSELYNYNALGQLVARAIGKWTDTIPCWKIKGEEGYPCGNMSKFSTTQSYSFGFDLAANLDTINDITHGIKTLGVFGVGNTDSLWNSVSITHDNDGDRSANGSAASYVWGADGRLLQVVVGSNTINYDYDVSGQLTRRQLNGVDDRYYLWDNGQLVGILNHAAQTDSIEYAYFPGTDQPFFQLNPAANTYFDQDAMGNVIGTHCCNEPTQSLRYDPWGNLQSVTTVFGDTTLLRWKGLLWESGPQLYYMRARWYDPATRRFVSPDPLDLGAGINQYAFAGGDPINGADPTGLLPCLLLWAPNDLDCSGDGDGGGNLGVGGPPAVEVTPSPSDPGSDNPNVDPTAPDNSSSPGNGNWGGGGGGSGGGKPPKNKVCSGPGFANARNFVANYQEWASWAASSLNTNTANILGLSGFESGWGTGGLVTANNNYFGLSAGPAFASGATGTYSNAQGQMFETYPSYLVAALAFSNSYFGRRVRGTQTAVSFAQALNAGGAYNSENLSAPYNSTLVGAINIASGAMKCP